MGIFRVRSDQDLRRKRTVRTLDGPVRARGRLAPAPLRGGLGRSLPGEGPKRVRRGIVAGVGVEDRIIVLVDVDVSLTAERSSFRSRLRVGSRSAAENDADQNEGDADRIHEEVAAGALHVGKAG